MRRTFATLRATVTKNSKSSPLPTPLHLEPAKATVDATKFAALSPVDRIKLIFDNHGEKAVQLASMQRTSSVLMHHIYRAQVPLPILFFDTQYLHQETYDLRDEFIKRYGLQIISVQPELTPEQQDRVMGKDLWKSVSGQPQCCHMRKEKPLLDTLRRLGVEATISGMMKAQGGARKNIRCVDQDLRLQTLTYNPLFDFSNAQLHAYAEEHNVPVHALYSLNYTSIGCQPCTTPIQPGEDDRAGRWRHLRSATGQSHMYCGMNQVDSQSIEAAKQKGSDGEAPAATAKTVGSGYLKKKKTSTPSPLLTPLLQAEKTTQQQLC